MSINEIVPIHDQIGASNQSMKASDTQESETNQKTATKKSAPSSDCLPESGGQSSFGSIGLLTAPIALYFWRRMQKFK
ncbi:MAG: hypothetical protein CL731_08675 [Chloroflexi bacterium]|nr:hypothetical protein [Chloroflexota bacterium]